MTIPPELFNIFTVTLIALVAWMIKRTVSQLDRIEARLDAHHVEIAIIKTNLNMARRRNDPHPVAPFEPHEL